MPDKWEYPWYAAWDLAFHMIPFARIDPTFAKQQLLLLLREWYMHPNGQLPAYEFAFSDVNPPVHAWAAWRVYKIAVGPDGQRDRDFLARVFQKLLLNFTWWVNRKDAHGKNIFSGGFLGLDNIGVFDRSQALPTGGHLEQADGTAWMAFYSATMLSMALELARYDPAYDDMASKFFEHFVGIADAINTLGGTGLWDEEDGFYYDKLHVDDRAVPLKVRSHGGPVAADRGGGAGGRGGQPSAGVQEADAMVPGQPPGPGRPGHLRRGRPPAPAAGHPVAGSPAAPVALPAGRTRVPVAVRGAFALAGARVGALPLFPRGPGVPGGLRRRPNRTPACSAATRTGAARSGSR